MKIFASKLLQKPLLDSPYRIYGFIIDLDRGKLLSIAVSVDYSRLVSFKDLEWRQGLRSFRLIDPEAVFNRSDLVRSNALIKEGKILRKQKVISEDGSFVGILNDFQIDTTLGVLTQIQTKKAFLLFGDKRLITRKKIITIDKNVITVEDDAAYSSSAQKKTEPIMTPPL